MFRFIALFFVAIILYRLLSTFLFNRQVTAKQRRQRGGERSAEPAEFEIIDDRPRPSSPREAEPEAAPRESQKRD